MLCAAILFSAILVAAPAEGQMSQPIPRFETPVTFGFDSPNGTPYPYGIAAGDIDNDGDPDIVVAHSGLDMDCQASWGTADGLITVFENIGDWDPPDANCFDRKDPILVSARCALGEIALVHVDGDDYLDMVVAVTNNGGSHTFQGVKIYFNNPLNPGDFTTRQPFALQTSLPVRGIVVSQIDGVFGMDIAATADYFGTDSDTVFVWLVDEFGNFPAIPEDLDMGLSDPAFVLTDLVTGDYLLDMQGSPRDELVVSTIDDDLFATVQYVPTPNPHFVIQQHPRMLDCDGTEVWASANLAAGNFGAGPRPDFAALQPPWDDDYFYVNVFHTWSGNIPSPFIHDCEPGTDHYKIDPPPESGGAISCVPPPFTIASGYLDAGQRLDLIATVDRHDTSNQVVMLLGKGDGTFRFDTDDPDYFFNVHPDGPNATEDYLPIRVVITDLNQDGYGDVVTANHLGENISVLINKMVTGIGP